MAELVATSSDFAAVQRGEASSTPWWMSWARADGFDEERSVLVVGSGRLLTNVADVVIRQAV